jgi:heme/copper-type cytochrome/quinol oxidase subunit 1
MSAKINLWPEISGTFQEGLMTISRKFLLAGCVYLLIGMLFGMYMGGTGDHTFAPLHAHINLLGFVLPAIFAVVYHLFPAMTGGMLAKAHFWLHSIGTLVVLILLFLLFNGTITEAAMVPLAPISEMFIVVGTAIFGWNVFKNVV